MDENTDNDAENENVECGEEEDEPVWTVDEAFWNSINHRSAQRLNEIKENKKKMKAFCRQYTNGFNCLRAMNNELHDCLEELYQNENRPSSNIILCVGITFVCKRFYDLFAQVEDDIEEKYEGRALKASEVRPWVEDLCDCFTESQNPVIKKYSLMIFVTEDYESFGYRHNDGYVLVDISNPDSSKLNVYSFRMACTKGKNNNVWIMLNSRNKFVSVVKDHEFGMFLYQVCDMQFIESLYQLPME